MGRSDHADVQRGRPGPAVRVPRRDDRVGQRAGRGERVSAVREGPGWRPGRGGFDAPGIELRGERRVPGLAGQLDRDGGLPGGVRKGISVARQLDRNPLRIQVAQLRQHEGARANDHPAGGAGEPKRSGGTTGARRIERFDEQGRPVWLCDERGRVSYRRYDQERNALVKTIQDVNSAACPAA